MSKSVKSQPYLQSTLKSFLENKEDKKITVPNSDNVVIICESDDSNESIQNSNIESTAFKIYDHLDLTGSQPKVTKNVLDKSKTDSIILINSSCEENTLKNESKNSNHNSNSIDNKSLYHDTENSLSEIKNLHNKLTSQSVNTYNSIDTKDYNDKSNIFAHKTKYSINIKKKIENKITKKNVELQSKVISDTSICSDINTDKMINKSTTTDDEYEFEKKKHKKVSKLIKKTKKFSIIDSDTSPSSSPTKKVDSKASLKQTIDIKNTAVKTNDERTVHKWKASIDLDHLNLNKLGFNEELMKWINTIKTDPLISSSTLAIHKQELMSKKNNLEDIQIEILEKIFIAFDKIPIRILTKFPEFDADIYQQLRSLYQRVKAKIRQADKKIQYINIQEQNDELQLLENKEALENSHNDIINNYETDTNAIANDHAFDVNFESEEYITRNNNSTLNNSCNNLGSSFNDLLCSNDQSLIKNLNKKTENVNSSMQTKRKSQFQLKMPIKATINPAASKQIQEMMSRNQQDIYNKELASNINIQEKINLTRQTPSPKNPVQIYEQCIDNLTNTCNTSNNQSNGQFIDNFKNDDTTDKFDSLEYPHSRDVHIQEKINLTQQTPSPKNPVKIYEQCIDNLPNTSNTSNNQSNGQFIGNFKNDGNTGKFDSLEYPHSRDMLNLFRQKFGLHQFRPNQLQAINAAILGYDCFVLMPTGGGKSLCYQLPGIYSSGITIVVSPLKSLIIDQVQKLNSLDIPASHLSGNISDGAAQKIYMELAKKEPTLKLLYVTPEKLSASQKICNALTALYERNLLARFVIDEAHCVSHWGHDFRPDYKKLKFLREKYPRVPTMALTATATPRVRTDILHQLRMTSPKWFMSSFNRPNLRYVVQSKKGKNSTDEIIGMIKTKLKNACGIVYCLSRKDCDNFANVMKANEIKALSYHAGLTDQQRIDIQGKWISEQIKVVCATIAFGMGIDKPNVRFVIHATLPKSIEGYYQESGRAGRDGENAECIMFYHYGDVMRHRKLIEMDESSNIAAQKTHMDNLFKIVAFCENKTDCRRSLQLNYFGELFDRSICISNRATSCDNCRTQGQFHDEDVTDHAKALIRLIRDLSNGRNNITILYVADIYKGSKLKKIRDFGHDQHPLYGNGKLWNKHEIERLMHKLVIDGYLKENLYINNEITCAYVGLGPKAQEFMTSDMKVFLQVKKEAQSSSGKINIAPNASNNSENMQGSDIDIKDLKQQCYTELAEIVNGIAGALDVSANSIMNMVALRIMSEQLPETEEAMLKIPHVTKANFLKYGRALLDITQKFAAEKWNKQKELIKTTSSIDATSYADDKDEWIEDTTTKLKGGRKRKGGYKSSRFAKFRRTVNSPRAGSSQTSGKVHNTRTTKSKSKSGKAKATGPGLVEFAQKKYPGRFMNII